MNDIDEFIVYLYHVCEMGYTSTVDLLKKLNKKENKITPLLEDEIEEYEKSKLKLESIINKENIANPSVGIIAKTSSKIGMSMELMRDNSDAKIADMLIQGYTMGILEVTKKLKKYKSRLEPNIVKIAEELIDYQNKNIKLLKKYL